MIASAQTPAGKTHSKGLACHCGCCLIVCGLPAGVGQAAVVAMNSTSLFFKADLLDGHARVDLLGHVVER